MLVGACFCHKGPQRSLIGDRFAEGFIWRSGLSSDSMTAMEPRIYGVYISHHFSIILLTLRVHTVSTPCPTGLLKLRRMRLPCASVNFQLFNCTTPNGFVKDSGEMLHVPRAYHGQSPPLRCGWNIQLAAVHLAFFKTIFFISQPLDRQVGRRLF